MTLNQLPIQHSLVRFQKFASERLAVEVDFFRVVSLRDLARRDARRDRETVVSSRKPGLARNSRPIFKTLYCLRQIIKALLCLKYVLKEVLGGFAVTFLARPCETLAREKSRLQGVVLDSASQREAKRWQFTNRKGEMRSRFSYKQK